ncbi:MAG: nucleotidyltransferase domain-containing protein [Chthonomonadales bacterium]
MLAAIPQLKCADIQNFCRKWKIKELFVFGSVLREDFRPDSDIDLMFTLESNTNLTLESWMRMESELVALLGHKVDLVPRKSVEESENYFRRDTFLPPPNLFTHNNLNRTLVIW